MENFINNGFAIAVAAFLLIRVEHQLKKLTDAILLLRHCQICRLSVWRLKLADDDEDLNSDAKAGENFDIYA
ncbi:MAG: YvrJ family protein [Synergistaceae bacterium]|nr:YvrJ family protein [Synergistaceae bacterium]